MKLSAALMAHPSRQAYVEELIPQLDREIPVVWDNSNSRWDTGSRALMAFEPKATHHLVLQDDAIVPRDLLAGIERMLEFCSPEVPVCLYTGKSRPNRVLVSAVVDAAQRQSASWIRMPGPWWGVGIINPVHRIAQLVEECSVDDTTENYDIRQAHFWSKQKIMCLYSIPSLVDHRSGPSLVPGRSGKGRVAHNAIAEGSSALDIEWNTKCLLALRTPEPGHQGDIRVLDPMGRVRTVSVKAYRRNLSSSGWTLYDETELSKSTSLDKGVVQVG